MGLGRRDVLAGLGMASLAGCSSRYRSSGASGQTELTVAVTTSVHDAGLLAALHPPFESAADATVRAVSAGTGETLAGGERGDVDAVMAHARPLEEAFVEAGHGLERRVFARGDFCVVGPPGDPAGVADADTARGAFERIAAAEAAFLSRGDGSGTHVRERAIWEATGIEPSGSWYHEAGQGMGGTLVQASQRGAYLLAVFGNVLAMADRLALETFVSGPHAGGDPALDNPYSVIVVDPASHEGVDADLATAYADYLTGPDGQEHIAAFEIGGQPAFYPAGAGRAVVDESERLESESATAGSSAVAAPREGTT